MKVTVTHIHTFFEIGCACHVLPFSQPVSYSVKPGYSGLASSISAAAACTRWAVPSSREYGADTSGALLTGDPLALARALRKIDGGAARRPLPARGALAASSHLMIAHPLPADGYGRLFLTHPPVGERVRRLEALAGGRG